MELTPVGRKEQKMHGNDQWRLLQPGFTILLAVLPNQGSVDHFGYLEILQKVPKTLEHFGSHSEIVFHYLTWNSCISASNAHQLIVYKDNFLSKTSKSFHYVA